MFLKRGFTLVEMLFVVIIAAGALALALPSYKSMRERGKFQAASGMLIDLGSAVESITRDLSMQGVTVAVGASGPLVYNKDTYEAPPNNSTYSLKTWVNAASAGKNREERVLKSLLPFGYIKKFQGQGNFSYYVLTDTTTTSGVLNNCKFSGVVACMIKPNPDSKDCFAGARYHKGGRFETIRMPSCKN